MSNQSDQQAALSWQAYLYAADQMPAFERAAFEARLDVEQDAREMLARVVQLTQAISALPGEAFSPAPAVVLPERRNDCAATTWRQPAAWMASGAAACWLLIAAFGSLDRYQSGRFDSANRPLVLAWSEYSSDAAQTDADDSDDDSSDDRTARPLDTASDTEPELVAPDWLVSALNLSDEDDAATTLSPTDDSSSPRQPTGDFEADGRQSAEEQ